MFADYFINEDCPELLFQCAFHFQSFGEDVEVVDVDLLKDGFHLLDLAEMQQEFTKKPGLKDLVIERVRLVRQSDEDFSGVAVGNINGEYVKFNVSCKYDGTSILWDANLPEEELDALKLKESARETYLLLKKTWPKVKASIGEKYDAAKKSVAESMETAKKKAGASEK